MSRILCPFCLKPHNFAISRTCPDHNLEVPYPYVNEYREVPPLWLATVGFPRHGKTTYLAALSLLLQHLAPVFPDLFFRELDQFTIDGFRSIRQEASEGKNTRQTPKSVSRPLLLSVYNLPESGSRCLVMYDVAGEVYRNFGELGTYVPSLKEVTTTWFLVSLNDLQENPDRMTITELFNIYLTGMQSMRVNLKGRNLIVVYTKADKLKDGSIRSYLQADPLKSLMVPGSPSPDLANFSYDDYIDRMGKMSQTLKEYTKEKIPLGAPFINMVQAQGMNLVFCVTSALGESPEENNGRLNVEAVRYRVLDPLFWAMKLEQPQSSTPFALLLDASHGSDAIYSNNLVSFIWDQLASQGELSTYYLGQSRIASLPDQNPPNHGPAQEKLRLLGPILAKLDPSTKLLAITTGRIIDLADFKHTVWRDRLLLVNIGEDHNNRWPNSIIFRDNDEPTIVINNFFNLAAG